jgi:hypothetical protein
MKILCTIILPNCCGQKIATLIVNGSSANIDLTGKLLGLYLLVNQKHKIAYKINKANE